jgi:hypothetical protein
MGDLLLKFIAAATAGTGLLVALSKGLSIVTRGMQSRRSVEAQGRVDQARTDIERFGAINDALEADNQRLRAEHEDERRRFRDEVEEMQGRLGRRIAESHELRNQLHKANILIQVLQLELDTERRTHGKPPFANPDEDGSPQ